ncbi:hypothetical protein [Kitasatospora sp. MBT66]|uniref:hypothetical protein n=1 Tax=Kitasatospora sp. MBT66 TaxID=1444769 RepID=UPI0005B89FC1|nr:hypothetical protein [Kitasatospora sp. MBT66]
MPGIYAHLVRGAISLSVRAQTRRSAFEALDAISGDDELLPELTLEGLRLNGVTIQTGTGRVTSDTETAVLEGAHTYPMTAEVMAIAYSDQGEVSEDAEQRAREALSALTGMHPVTAAVPAGNITLGALRLDADQGDEGLVEVDGVSAEDMCANADCRESTADGEGYDGECGDCADRTYAASADDA